MRIRPVNMEFLYGTTFLSQSPEAYERLIMDAMRGDATLFTRNDEVEAQWRIIDPIVQAWAQRDGRRARSTRRARRGRPRPASLLRGRRQLARDLSGEPRAHARRQRHRLERAGARRPATIEAALRAMLNERHSENASYVPARTLNLVCVVDKAVERRDRQPPAPRRARHAARTVVCAVEPRRTAIDAVATIASDVHPQPGEFALLRETVIVDVGEQHLPHLDTIVDPLVVTDLPTVVWAPHGHHRGRRGAARRSRRSCCSTPSTSQTSRDALGRALRRCSTSVYVVDLAWLRSTPWRERVAATFDPPHLRPDLRTISAVTVRHQPESAVAALLLLGWLASRLDWRAEPAHARATAASSGRAHARRQDVALAPRAGARPAGARPGRA